MSMDSARKSALELKLTTVGLLVVNAFDKAVKIEVVASRQ